MYVYTSLYKCNFNRSIYLRTSIPYAKQDMTPFPSKSPRHGRWCFHPRLWTRPLPAGAKSQALSRTSKSKISNGPKSLKIPLGLWRSSFVIFCAFSTGTFEMIWWILSFDFLRFYYQVSEQPPRSLAQELIEPSTKNPGEFMTLHLPA